MCASSPFPKISGQIPREPVYGGRVGLGRSEPVENVPAHDIARALPLDVACTQSGDREPLFRCFAITKEEASFRMFRAHAQELFPGVIGQFDPQNDLIPVLVVVVLGQVNTEQCIVAH